MIASAYPLHPTEGYRLDLRCPVIVCDTCGAVIDADHPGNRLWDRGRGNRVASVHVHKGRQCSAAFDHLRSSEEIGQWLARLVRNHDDPLEVTLPSTGDTFNVTEWQVIS